MAGPEPRPGPESRPGSRTEPATLPADSPATALPTEILLDSRRVLTRTLLRHSWKPAIVLVVVWYLLLVTYILSTSPLLWTTGLLFTASNTETIRMVARSAGFTPWGIGLSFLLLPVLATALSFAMIPLASRAIAALQPRRFLSEEAFQNAVRRRAAGAWITPPLAGTALLVLLVCCQVPLQWQDLSYGVLSGIAFGLGVLACAWPILCALNSPPVLLGVLSVRTQVHRWQIAHGEEKENRGAVLLAQDRRDLPPTRSRIGVGMLLRGLGVTALSSLRWVGIAALCLAWPTFLVADSIATFRRLVDTTLTDPSSTGLPWQTYLVLGLALGGLALVAAIAPVVACAAAEPMRAQVKDRRTPGTWAQRAALNPWEVRVCRLVGVFNAVAAVFAAALSAVLIGLFGVFGGVDGTWLAFALLLLVPLYGVGSARAMRHHLRYVIYGPADRYMRRAAPIALVAPEQGTRADRARDPEVRAEVRRRIRLQGENADPALIALDEGSSEFWVDDSLPGATDHAADAEAIARGELPDFGGDTRTRSPRNRDSAPSHEIPDGLTGLQEVRPSRRR